MPSNSQQPSYLIKLRDILLLFSLISVPCTTTGLWWEAQAQLLASRIFFTTLSWIDTAVITWSVLFPMYLMINMEKWVWKEIVYDEKDNPHPWHHKLNWHLELFLKPAANVRSCHDTAIDWSVSPNQLVSQWHFTQGPATKFPQRFFRKLQIDNIHLV